jgi:hypothetical protein
VGRGLRAGTGCTAANMKAWHSMREAARVRSCCCSSGVYLEESHALIN